MGVTTAPADPASQGAPRTQGAQAGCPKIFSSIFTLRPCSISGVYGFALFDEFVGTDRLDQARFARNVFDFLACWHMIV